MSQAEGPKETSGFIPCAQLPLCVGIFRTAFVRKIVTKKGINEVTIEETRQYDFNFPSSSEYKNSKEWSIFDSNFFQNKKEFEGYYTRTEAHYKSVIDSVSDNGRYVITLSNRIEGVGTEKPELLFILPSVKKDLCEGTIRKANDVKLSEAITIPTLDDPPNLLPLSETVNDEIIVTLPKNATPVLGCVEAAGEYYYYQIIYEF